MLDITNNTIEGKIDKSKLESFRQIQFSKYSRALLRVCWIFLGIGFVLLFLPWTQNILSKGYVTTLMPDKRPQEVNAVISGRIEKWYVREGSMVHKGDTIVFISEIKSEYFDPELLMRTELQIKAKKDAINAYKEKIEAQNGQLESITIQQSLKLKQAKNKLQQAYLKMRSDSMELEATKTNLSIAEKQYDRISKLQQDGLKSLTDLEEKKAKLQKEQATIIKHQNDLLGARNEILNAQMEIINLDSEYNEKLAKIRSERSSAQSNLYDAQAGLAKLENTFRNYQLRSGFYFITAPQSGLITKVAKSGLGEVIKDGEPVVTIMPEDYELAVEMYVRPRDIPLIQIGEKTRIIFDGWPSIVFSGWPNASFGTFGGEVVAIDRFISTNGMYRIMVAPDHEDIPWPEGVSVGSGASTITLLEDVPIWYEIWRQLNGFPPDYYEGNSSLQMKGQNIIKDSKKSKK
jgi:multidrug resistance efflux pump